MRLSFAETEQNLRAALSRPLPGKQAHSQLAPQGRAQINIDDLDHSRVKHSAVMALLYPHKNNPFLIITERLRYAGVHSGQISLPGGKREKTDKDYLDTALRETEEEIGLGRQQVEVLGALSPLYIPPSNYLVYPFTGLLREKPELSRQESEVHKIISIDLNHLLHEESVSQEVVSARGFKMKVPVFNVEGVVIWGATAMILSELRELAISS